MEMHGTTIIGVKHEGYVAVAGDGQVTLGEQVIMKGNARKVRKIAGGKAICGFAGSTADAFTLEERFEAKFKEYNDLTRAAVELAKEWRMDKVLRQLNAMLLTADKERILLISGNGDVIEPEHNVVAIGSGGSFALAAARGILSQAGASSLSAEDIARQALGIAADICVFTNHHITVETLA